MNQLAMSFFWDMSRMPNGLQCLERGVWNLRFDVFMEEYLTLAHALKRNTVGVVSKMEGEWEGG